MNNVVEELSLPTAKKLKEDADKAYLKGTIESRQDAAEQYSKIYRSTIIPPHAHFTRTVLSNLCQSRYELAEIDESIKDARTMISTAPAEATKESDNLTAKSHFRLARALTSSNEYTEALATLDFLSDQDASGLTLQDGVKVDIEELRKKIAWMKVDHPKPILPTVNSAQKPKRKEGEGINEADKDDPGVTMFLYRCIVSHSPKSRSEFYDLQILLPTQFSKPQGSTRASHADYAQFTSLMLPIMNEVERYLRRDGYIICANCGKKCEGEQAKTMSYRHSPMFWGYKRYVRDSVVIVCGSECDRLTERDWLGGTAGMPSVGKTGTHVFPK